MSPSAATGRPRSAPRATATAGERCGDAPDLLDIAVCRPLRALLLLAGIGGLVGGVVGWLWPDERDVEVEA